MLCTLISIILNFVFAFFNASSAAAQDVIAQYPNECPEGQFLDLYKQSCRPLFRKSLGFERSEFLNNFQSYGNNVHTLNSCTEAELNSKLDNIKSSGGGIIIVPVCTIAISGKIRIPSNLILRGNSASSSHLAAASGFSTHLLDALNVKNVVIQDLGLKGDRSGGRGIVIRKSQNILLERLKVESFGVSGVSFNTSSRVTVRYVRSENNRQFHGIVSKDCNQSTLSDCISAAGDLGSYGSVFTSNYSVYSNYTQNNGTDDGQGIDLHAEKGEVAGNYSSGNINAAKFPDAFNVVIHHNFFEGGVRNGVRLYSTYDIQGRRVHDVVFYRNVFRITADYTLRNGEDDESVYMIENTFEAGDKKLIRNPGNTLFACRGTEETDGTVEYSYFPYRLAPNAFCSNLGFLSLFKDIDAIAPGSPLFLRQLSSSTH